jgi:hypothetical protein
VPAIIAFLVNSLRRGAEVPDDRIVTEGRTIRARARINTSPPLTMKNTSVIPSSNLRIAIGLLVDRSGGGIQEKFHLDQARAFQQNFSRA